MRLLVNGNDMNTLITGHLLRVDKLASDKARSGELGSTVLLAEAECITVITTQASSSLPNSTFS